LPGLAAVAMAVFCSLLTAVGVGAQLIVPRPPGSRPFWQPLLAFPPLLVLAGLTLVFVHWIFTPPEGRETGPYLRALKVFLGVYLVLTAGVALLFTACETGL
jgi:hypothetical protein